MVFEQGNILNNIFALKIVESHLAPGWNYRIYIGLLIIPVLAICRSLCQILIKYFLKYIKGNMDQNAISLILYQQFQNKIHFVLVASETSATSPPAP